MRVLVIGRTGQISTELLARLPAAAVRRAVAELLAPGTAPRRFADFDAGLDDVY